MSELLDALRAEGYAVVESWEWPGVRDDFLTRVRALRADHRRWYRDCRAEAFDFRADVQANLPDDVDPAVVERVAFTVISRLNALLLSAGLPPKDVTVVCQIAAMAVLDDLWPAKAGSQ